MHDQSWKSFRLDQNHDSAPASLRQILRLLLLGLLIAGWIPARGQNATSIRLEVDASQAPRRMIHSRLVMPVKAGPMALAFPKWIQGEHGPTGPVTDTMGLTVTANEKALVWRRDPVDMFSVQVLVPDGVQEIVVTQDFLSPTATSGFSGAASATDHLFTLNWNQVLLFPRGERADRIQFAPCLVRDASRPDLLSLILKPLAR